jgi:hypothetical protein
LISNNKWFSWLAAAHDASRARLGILLFHELDPG